MFDTRLLSARDVRIPVALRGECCSYVPTLIPRTGELFSFPHGICMMFKLRARTATFDDDGKCTLLGFADDANRPVHYFLLQIANDPDEEERACGWDGIHLDAGSLDLDGYDPVEDIRQTAIGVVIRLAGSAARRAGIEPDIEIALESERIGDVFIGEAVRRFKDRLMTRDEAKTLPPSLS